MTFVTETFRGPGLLARLSDKFTALIEIWDQYRVYTRTYAELNALSTRELDDLGISRSMISRLALEAAYGQRGAQD